MAGAKMIVSDYMKLTDEQIYQWNQWRARYGTAEDAGNALCPDYLQDKETLQSKLTACYEARLREGAKAVRFPQLVLLPGRTEVKG